MQGRRTAASGAAPVTTMGFISDNKARREAEAARRREEAREKADAAARTRAAVARESGLSCEELLAAWKDPLTAAGIDPARVAIAVDGSQGTVFRRAFDMSDARTSVDRGVVLATERRQLAYAFRRSAYGNADPAELEVIVRSFGEIREPRQKEDRSFIIVFEGDRLFVPACNPLQGDAWEIRHPQPDVLYHRFSEAGLPW
jgi:hypothetical protein